MQTRISILAALLVLLSGTGLPAQSRSTWPSTTVLDGATATGASSPHKPAGGRLTIQAYGATSAGAGAATIVIEVSNIETPATDADWLTAGTITLTLSTTRATDGFSIVVPWRNIRARVSAISGTDAAVSVRLGVSQ